MKKLRFRRLGYTRKAFPAITVRQPDGCVDVMRKYASETGTSLTVCGPFIDTFEGGEGISLGLHGKHQGENATLAVHLCREWVLKCGREDLKNEIRDPVDTPNDPAIACSFRLPKSFRAGLEAARWPGRCEIVQIDNEVYGCIWMVPIRKKVCGLVWIGLQETVY